jgi:hypothetical protein
VVAELLGLLEVVRGEEDRGALGVYALDVVPQLEPQLHVHARGRLVEDQQARPVHQRPGEDQSALHPARQRARALVPLRRERERVEQLAGALAALLARHPEVAAVVVERLLARQEPVEVEVLRRQADRETRLLVVVDRVVAEHANRAGGGLGKAGGAVDQRGLAGAVRAEQAEELAGLDPQRNATQGLDPGGVALEQVIDFEGGHAAEATTGSPSRA